MPKLAASNPAISVLLRFLFLTLDFIRFSTKELETRTLGHARLGLSFQEILSGAVLFE